MCVYRETSSREKYAMDDRIVTRGKEEIKRVCIDVVAAVEYSAAAAAPCALPCRPFGT